MKNLSLLLAAMIISFGGFSQKLMKSMKDAHAGEILSVAINKDGSKIVTVGSDKRSYVWDTKEGAKLKSFGSHAAEIKGVSLNNNGKLFATASLDKKIIVWNMDDGKPASILKSPGGGFTCVEYSSLDDTKASGCDDGNIVLWSDANKLITTMAGHSKKVNDVTFSPDGKYLASGSDDNSIIVWDLATYDKKITIEPASKSVNSLCYSSDGKYILCGGATGQVTVWDAASGNKVSEFEGLKSPINTVLFTQDVQYVIAGGDDNKLVIWEMEMQQVIKEVAAHAKGITDIKIDDKGINMVTIARDGSYSIWNISGLNIGKKKFITDDSKPRLVCTPVKIEEKDENGIIDAADNAKITFSVKNQGEGIAYDVVVEIASDRPIIGFSFDGEYYIGNIQPGKAQNVSVDLSATSDMETAMGTFKISVKEANGNDPQPQELAFQTKGSNNAYIMVMDYKYSSATGKAETGAPITLILSLKNSTNAEAKGIKVNYIFPENVMAVDKRSETIDFQANELKQARVQFYATEKFTEENIKLGLDIEGAAYTNLNDIALSVKINDELPVNTETFVAETEAHDQPLYRGGGDPLKGLKTADAKKELQMGNYYALIIGIDGYTGDWNGLKNAVGDAKAVENVLKTKYKFDYFRTLYDVDATHDAIVAEMEWLVAHAKENDNVFIYYSGHGDYKQALNKGYWVPVDASTTSTSKYISNSDIQTFLGGINSKHTLLIADACFSGDIFRGNTTSVPFENSEKYYQKVNGLVSRQAISSGGIEPVMDGGREGHSVFAYYLLKSLENNNYKYFDAGQLYSKIKIPVVNNSEQSPNFSPIKNTGDEGGQFVFIKK